MTQANSTLFLSVGAGGSHGATGNHVVRQLLARGLSVRAFVRQADERAKELGELVGARLDGLGVSQIVTDDDAAVLDQGDQPVVGENEILSASRFHYHCLS